MRVRLRDVILLALVLALVLVVPVWSSTTNHSLPHSLTPVLGTSVFISHARLLQTGEEVGVPLSHSHCFTHQMTAHSAHFRAGDMWEICVSADALLPAVNIATPIVPLETEVQPSVVTPNNDPETTKMISLIPEPVEAEGLEGISLNTADSPSINTAVVYVNALATDAAPIADDCNGLAVFNRECNLRSAMQFCDDFLLNNDRKCIISLLPVGGVLLLDPALDALKLDELRGELRVEGNACRLSLLPSSLISNRLFDLEDTSEFFIDFMFSASNMTISGFGSIGSAGGAMYLQGISVSLDNVLFQRNTGLVGGAVCFHRCHDVKISNSQFVNNTAASDGGGINFAVDNLDIIVTSCKFIGNNVLGNDASDLGTETLYMGGGMCVNRRNENIRMSNCHFEGNSATRGGAVGFFRDNSEIIISQSTFVRNIGFLRVGGIDFSLSNTDIMVTNCEFFMNYGTEVAGALRFNSDNSEITISGVLFERNYLSSVQNENITYGGALLLSDRNGDVDITNCTFRQNSIVNGLGGAVCIIRQNLVDISNCTFEDNSVAIGNGGALYVDNDNTVALRDLIFVRNTAIAGSGGSVYCNSRNYLPMCERLLFVENKAGKSGGALSFGTNNVNVVVSNCAFYRNAAGLSGGGNGGALHVDNDNSMLLRDLIFVQNNVTYGSGGGVYFNSRNLNSLCEGLTFVENVAGESGGALTFLTSNLNAMIRNCTFTGNSAGALGGAVYSALANSEMVFIDSSFTFNTAMLYGGAIYFGERHMNSVHIINSVIEWNTAHEAGGIFVLWFNDRIQVDGCRIRFNFAEHSPGAIRTMSWSVVITNSIISGNVAGHDYGGIYIDDSRETLIRNSDLSNNSALGKFSSRTADVRSMGCGSIGIFNCDNVVVENCTLNSNDAYNSGGGTCIILSDDVTIRNTLIHGNSALIGGAGATILGCDNVLLDSVQFENNVVEGDGGGLYVAASTSVVVSNSTFLHNVVGVGSGSACHIVESDVRFEITVFDANEAIRGAGTVFWLYDELEGMEEPTGLRSASNTFTDSNVAAYGASRDLFLPLKSFVVVETGDRWATDAVKLGAFKEQESNNSYTIEIVDYEVSLPAIMLTLLDFYDQEVVIESEGFAQLSVPANASRQECGANYRGNIGGVIVEKFVNGTAVFAEVDAFCVPEGVMFLDATSDLALHSTDVELRFRPCVVGEYFADRICSPCPNGTYSFTDPAEDILSLTRDLSSTVCKTCPTGADHCFKDQIIVTEGHWRISQTSEAIFQCPWIYGSCLGGSQTGDESCGSLYSGPLCAVCIGDDFYMESTGECVSCGDPSSWFDPFTVTVIVLLSISTLVGSYYFSLRMREQKLQSMTELLIYSVLKLKLVDTDVYVNAPLAVNENILILTRRLRALLKMYITFLQVVSTIPLVLNFHDIPDGLDRRMVEMSSVVNIGISKSALFKCSFGFTMDFVDQLLIVTIFPVVVLFLFIVVYHVHLQLKLGPKSTYQSSTPDDTASSSPTYDGEAGVVRAKYIESFLFFTYLILPSLVVTIFETFRCLNVDPDNVSSGGDSYMRADYSISCHSSRYHFAVGWALMMILVYVLGVPAFYFYLLYSNRSAIISRDLTTMLVDNRGNSAEQRQLSAIRVLFDNYKPCFWYWELVETAFRLSLTGFLVMGVFAGDNMQMLLGLALAIVFTKLYEYFDPFLDDLSQSSKVVTLWEICLIFFLFILMKADFISNLGIVFVAYSLMIAVILNMALALVRILWQFSNDTSAHNLEALGQRERSISGATFSTGQDGGSDKQFVTSVVFSPFDVEGQLTRKSIKI